MIPAAPGPPDLPPPGYLRRWLQLGRGAWLYLGHAAMLTGSLAMAFLVFNLAIVALELPPIALAELPLPLVSQLDIELPLLGVLGSLSIGVAALLALPLLWLVNRIGFWWALVANALLQASSMFIFALVPTTLPLLFAVSLTGIGGVLFQVSSVPFMIRLSDETTRDHLFSANFAVNIGVAGLGSLLAGNLAVWFAAWLAVPTGDPLAYRGVFVVAGALLLLSLIPLLLLGRHRALPRSTSAAATPPDAAPATQRTPAQASVSGWWAALVQQLPLARYVPEPWYGLLLRPWPVLRLMLPPFLISCGAALLIPYLNLFFSQRFGVSDNVLGVIIAALGLTAGLTALIGPVISIRIGKMQTIVLTQACSLPFLLIVGFVPMLVVVVAAAMIRQGLFNMSSPLYDAFAMERTDEALRPTVIGAINGAFAAGYFLMPIVSTRIQIDYGFTPLFLMTGTFYLLAITANYWLFLRPTPARRAAVPAADTSEFTS